MRNFQSKLDEIFMTISRFALIKYFEMFKRFHLVSGVKLMTFNRQSITVHLFVGVRRDLDGFGGERIKEKKIMGVYINY